MHIKIWRSKNYNLWTRSLNIRISKHSEAQVLSSTTIQLVSYCKETQTLALSCLSNWACSTWNLWQVQPPMYLCRHIVPNWLLISRPIATGSHQTWNSLHQVVLKRKFQLLLQPLSVCMSSRECRIFWIFECSGIWVSILILLLRLILP